MEQNEFEWPTEWCSRLKYDSFAGTWSLSSAESEIFTEQLQKLMGREPVDGMKVVVKVLVTPMLQPPSP